MTDREIYQQPFTSGSCNIDVACNAAFANTAAAVAQIRFQSGGYTYSCSGTLMNNAANDYKAYFLTANHCINSQTVASTIESRWFMQAQTCGDPSVTIDSRYATVTGGATLLYNSAATDTSFLQLVGAPPAGAYYSGWDATAYALGTAAAGVHHPSGDIKKISTGSIYNYQNCTDSGNGTFSCTTASGTTGNFINARLTSGTTEPGSSGSGLFVNSGVHLVGQLYGGNSSCTNLSGSNIYGRFDIPYYAALKTWLWPADSRKALTITRAGTGLGTVTSSPAGINCGATCSAPFALNALVVLTAVPDANNVFAGWSGACAGSGSTCTVTMSADTAVTATFNATGTRVLSVTKTGNGTVASSPAGISCGSGCSNAAASFTAGSAVTLTATADSGYNFAGWSGACSGMGACTLSMSTSQSVTASFQQVATLSSNTPVTNITGSSGSQSFYQITLPANANITSLKVMTSGGTGDVDLYVKQGSYPSNLIYDCKSDSTTTTESCSVASPIAGGTYYVLLDAYTDYSGVNLSMQIQGTATVSITKKGTGTGTVIATAINNANVLSAQDPAGVETPRTLPKDLRPKTALQPRFNNDGLAPVIVGLRVPFAPEGELKSASVAQQRQEIAASQTTVISQLRAAEAGLAKLQTYEFIPFMALHATPAELNVLYNSPDVISLEEDQLAEPMLSVSAPLIGATTAWGSGYSGAGQTVAVLDTGVDSAHPFLAGKVVSEACYSTNASGVTSLCPGAATVSTATGSAMPCSGLCYHGTHVAGIAAGRGSSFSGVAKDANLIAIQVFSKFTTDTNCGTGKSPCVLSYTSNQLSALQRVYALRNTYAIAAVNMSIGGSLYTSNCDASISSTKTAIDNLRSVGIPTVIAAGNNGSSNSLSSPGCISSAISVGSTYASAGYDNTCSNWSVLGTSSVDEISCFSNSASFLSLLAPGSKINSSLPGAGYGVLSGTSMATPHVAGAWAVYKQKYPQASLATVLSAFQQTGVAVLDPRNNLTKSRINLAQALSLSPSDLINCGSKCLLTLNLGDQITLSNTPTGTNQFAGWSGRCSGSASTCTITIDGNQTVTAAFDTLKTVRAKKSIPLLMLLLDD